MRCDHAETGKLFIVIILLNLTHLKLGTAKNNKIHKIIRSENVFNDIQMKIFMS